MQCCTLVCTPGNGATNVVAGRGRKQLAQGFERWRGWAVENARRMRGLRAIMAKMRSRDCAVAFAAWWHHWAEKQRLRAAALRVVAHMQQVALSGSFTWWSYWAKKNSQIAAMALRMQSVLTGRAFVSWLEAVETWQSERADEVSAAAASTS